MMPQPFGPLAKSEHAIADALVECTWFPKFSKRPQGTMTAEQWRQALLQRVHFDKLPNPSMEDEVIGFPDLHLQRPFVCLWPAQPAGRLAWRTANDATAVGLDFQVYFEADDNDATIDDPAIDPDKSNELFRWWLNMIGVLLVGDQAIQAGGLIEQPNVAIQRITAVDIWHTTGSPGLGSFFSAIATITTGTDER